MIPMIFDGLVDVYSTCRECRHIMRVTDSGDTVHPNCDPQPRQAETLAAHWLHSVLGGDELGANSFESAILDLDSRMPRLLEAALLYASWGWLVFPLATLDKQPAIPNAHPDGDPLRGHCKGGCGKLGHGVHDATRDAAWIASWWREHPRHNIGLAAGHLFDVIDVDPRHGGVPSFLQQLSMQHIPSPCHGVVATASGGMHLYVKATGKGNFAGLYPGIDYRGRGGYAVAPPSTRGAARAWSWVINPSPIIKVGQKIAK